MAQTDGWYWAEISRSVCRIFNRHRERSQPGGQAMTPWASATGCGLAILITPKPVPRREGSMPIMICVPGRPGTKAALENGLREALGTAQARFELLELAGCDGHGGFCCGVVEFSVCKAELKTKIASVAIFLPGLHPGPDRV